MLRFKLLLIYALLFMSVINLYSQVENDKKQVIIVGFKNFEQLVSASPKKWKGTKNWDNIGIIIEKKDLPLFESRKKDFKYFILDSNCYEIIRYSSFVYEYIIPNASEDIISILNKTYQAYPPIYIDNLKEVVDERYYLYYNLKCHNILYHNFLLVLVNTQLYNTYQHRFSEPSYKVFKENDMNSKYIKVLIPLNEDR